jgi:hypothetical protein
MESFNLGEFTSNLLEELFRKKVSKLNLIDHFQQVIQ